jgi:hypothetical protein
LIELRKNDQIAAVAKVDGALREEEGTESGEAPDGTADGGPEANGTEVDNSTPEE